MKTVEKFTATLVTPADKEIVVDMRERSGLSEKQLMTLIIATAVEHEDEIMATAKSIVASEMAEKEERRKFNYELLKSKMREAREEARKMKSPRLADAEVE